MRDRVIQEVRREGLDVQVETLSASTRTVEDAASAVGCDSAQIAKSIVFVADGDPVVCVASGDARIDPELVCDALDCAEARAASAAEVRAATGFSPGGVPPLAHGLPVVFDAALLEHDRIWSAGGDDHSVFAVAPRVLAACTRAVVAPLTSR